jgi:hypothetical protein
MAFRTQPNQGNPRSVRIIPYILGMKAATLYEALSIPAHGEDRDRTQRTLDHRETIDADRLIVDLYSELSEAVIGVGSDVGRTEVTRIASPETVDRDRAEPAVSSALLGPPVDLYGALSAPTSGTAVDAGETAITASTETIDWDQPPEL